MRNVCAVPDRREVVPLRASCPLVVASDKRVRQSNFTIFFTPVGVRRRSCPIATATAQLTHLDGRGASPRKLEPAAEPLVKDR